MATAIDSPETAMDIDVLLDPVRRLLAERCTELDIRRIMATETGHDAYLWRTLCDLGVPKLMIPEAMGGIGLGPIAAERVMEEAGAALLPAPLISTWVACALLDAAGERDLWQSVAAGEQIAAVAFCGTHFWQPAGDLRVESGTLSGTARFVPDAQIADVILLVLDRAVYVIDRADARVSPLPTFDRTRRLADVRFTGRARAIGDPRGSDYAYSLALVALAGEQAGGARRALEMTVDYARTRHQFGRAIGSFQAIKHMAADLLLEAESATSAARDAARALEEGGDDAAVALAAFACADAYVRVTKDAIQMHGGIAFTWEHPAHLYLRRARSAAQLYGDPSHWRERYIGALEAIA